MKNLFFAFLLTCSLHSCIEGLPGNIYLAISTDGYVTYYLDNNSCIPYGMYFETYYGPCTEGTYSFEYGITNGAYWYGTYYIYANAGTVGLLAGVDGEDNYFTLNCTFGGSSIYGREGKPLKGKNIKAEENLQVTEYYLPDYTVVLTQTKVETGTPEYGIENRKDTLVYE